MNNNENELISSLIEEQWLRTSNIIDAFRNAHRNNFVSEEFKNEAFLNTALPIGRGQTISQPLVVAFMLELLQPEANQKILEIGYGSGWQTALLAHIVGQKGKVFAFEVVPQLCDFGRENISKYGFIEKGIVECFCKDATGGLIENAPYDGIIAAASAQENIPPSWRNQLKPNGRIVAPVKNSIWLIVKKSENRWEEKEYPGFAFVPLVQ